MNFLYPLFLAGIAAVGIPIILHMIRRHTHKRVTFSSLMFLHTTVPRFKNRSRIENLLLLILRCLILCLLAFGFARPFFAQDIEKAPAYSGSRIVLLIDTSASMRRTGMWDQTIHQAQSILEDVNPTDRVCVMSFDQSTQTLIGFEQWATLDPDQRISIANEHISTLSPGWARTDLGQALVNAAEAIEDDEVNERLQSTRTHRIVLISDLQEGAAFEALHAYEWPERTELIVKQIPAKGNTNATLQYVASRDSTTRSKGDERLHIRVTNSPDATVERFSLNWVGGDTTSESIADVYAPAGHSVMVRVPFPADKAAVKTLILSGDDHEFDNALYLAPHLIQQANILYLGGEDVNDSKGMLFYVQRAFSDTAMLNPQIIFPPADRLTDETISTAHLVIVTDTLNRNNISPLSRYLRAGGTVLLAMTSSDAAATIANLTGIDNIESEEADVDTYTMLSQMDFEHPLLTPFSEPRFGDFTQIHFWKHRRINIADLPDAKILARFDNNDPAWFELNAEAGSLLVMTSGWHPSDSQLALSTKFVPLLYSILEYSGVLTGQQTRYFVGDPVMIPIVSRTSQDVQIRKPDGTQTSFNTDTKAFTQTDIPGFYTVESPAENRLFAINLPAKESQTAVMPIDDLEQYGVVLSRTANLTAEGPELSSDLQSEWAKHRGDLTGLEYKQKLWRWVFMVLLAISLIEIGLAGWLTRAPSIIEGEQT
ncbi:MAG: BatA domain-containing protein [Sedimentisphaerales bacterium]|nr:BatA domain-containing protein [Sedimentisphaerales bacterium]